ncbi:MAG: RdgB/HAM1 family non-canonical purine NTP pyrophosphatase [Longimicrobiales bacterium]
MNVLLATRSAHKAGEIREILGPNISLLTLEEAGLEWLPEEEELEPYDTFEANALSKAQYFSRRSGLATIADDSGLEVDALNGAPGVRTKRFAKAEDFPGLDQDQANNQHLLSRLDGVEEQGRGARFVCVAVLLTLGPPTETVFRGEAEGRILPEMVGAGGFGYDPVFFDPEVGKSFAELSLDEKNARSHRGKAFRALAKHLNSE